MATYTLLTGQVSDIIPVPAGSRVTMSGSGSIQWTPGKLVNAAASTNWQMWSLGSTPGYKDALRDLCIKATATGPMTVIVENGVFDKYPANAYWEEDIATTSAECENFGASPTASASVNAAAINAALANGGLVTLTTPGTYYINSALLVPSNTTFKLGSSVIIRRTQGVDTNILRNVNAQSTPFNITTLAVYTTAPFNTGRGVFVQATTSTAHGLGVGDYAFIAGALPNEYNGVWRVVAVPDSTHFVYALSLYNDIIASGLTTPATVNTGTSGTNMYGVTVVSGNAQITLPAPKATVYVVGMTVGMTNWSTPTPSIVSIDSSTKLTLTGTATASNSTTTMTSSQYAYSSIVGMKADHDITIEGGVWYQDWYTDDGSAVQAHGLTGDGLYSVILGRVRNVTVRDMVFNNVQIGLVGLNLQDATIENLNSYNSGSTLQLMSGGRNITASKIRGQTWDVMASLLMGNWPKWRATNLEFLTDMQGLTLRDLHNSGGLYTFQISGQAGVKLRDILIDGVAGTVEPGQGMIGIYDDLAIGSGTTIDSLRIRDIRSDNSAPYGSAVLVSSNAYTNNTTGPTIDRLSIEGSTIYCPTSAQSSTLPYGIALAPGAGYAKINYIDITNTKLFSSSNSGSTGITLSALQGRVMRLSNVEVDTVQILVNNGFVGGGSYFYNNVSLNSSGFLQYGWAASTMNRVFLNSVSISSAAGNVFGGFGSSWGTISVNGVDFDPTIAGGWLQSPNSNWTAFWNNPYWYSYSITAAASITPDVRNGTVQRNTANTGGTSVAVPAGANVVSGNNRLQFTLILTASATGTDAWTFASGWVMAANSGQVGQVLTPGAGNANKKMVLQFIYDGSNWVQTNVGSWN